MLRFLTLLCAALALAALAGDFYFGTQGEGAIRLGALGEWWARIHRESLLLLQPAVERHITPAIWDPGIQTLLEWPAAVEFALLALVFWVLRRITLWRRRRRAPQ